jgi:protein TonB
LSFDIPVGVPDVDIPLAGVRQSEFSSAGETFSSGYENNAPLSQTGKVAYDSREVDRQVAALAGIVPEYPASLRAAGIEGEVRAQFVVDASGRADIGSLRILSSTNELFAEAVKRALPKMKFIPARIGSRAVAEMVQQAFVFRLDR